MKLDKRINELMRDLRDHGFPYQLITDGKVFGLVDNQKMITPVGLSKRRFVFWLEAYVLGIRSCPT